MPLAKKSMEIDQKHRTRGTAAQERHRANIETRPSHRAAVLLVGDSCSARLVAMKRLRLAFGADMSASEAVRIWHVIDRALDSLIT
nr:hypothetical protein CFP56_56933 [Quercus suber]